MKKIVALMLALMMTFALCACETVETAAETAVDTDDVTEIVFWYSRGEQTGIVIEDAVKEFNETIGAEKGISVKAIYQGSCSDASTKMRTVLQGGDVSQLPDLMEIDATGILDYRTSGYAFSMDEALAQDTEYDISPISAAALKNWYYADTQWGVPFTITTHVMFYNKTIFDAAGITEVPTTFAEIAEKAALLPAENANGQALKMYACLPSSIYLAYWLGQLPNGEAGASYVVNNRNGRDAVATELVCDKEGTLVKFLTAWKELYASGALVNTGDGITEMFASEQIAMMTGDTANTVSLLEQIGDRFEMGCALFPRIDESANFGNQVSGSALCMFKKNDDKKAMAAWELLKFMISAKVQSDIGLASGYIPCNSASFELPEYQAYIEQYPQMKIGPEQLEITSPDDVGINVGPSIDFYLEIQAQVSDMLENDIAPEEAAEKLAASLNAMLADYLANNQ